MPDQQPAAPAPTPTPAPPPEPRREWTDKDVPGPGKEHHGDPPGTI